MGKKDRKRTKERKKVLDRKFAKKHQPTPSALAPRGGRGALAGQAGGGGRGVSAGPQQRYHVEQRTLVVGDGDFSFAAGLVQHRGGGHRLFASSYDTLPQVLSKYGHKATAERLQSIRGAGAQVAHGVDATDLEGDLAGALREMRAAGVRGFDRVVFNFPHTGQQRVHLNRALVADFFASALRVLAPAGEVHMTIKERPPYSLWGVEKLAQGAGLLLSAKLPFLFALFPGYEHRTTDPEHNKLDTFEKHCQTYVFKAAGRTPTGDRHSEGEVDSTEDLSDAEIMGSDDEEVDGEDSDTDGAGESEEVEGQDDDEEQGGDKKGSAMRIDDTKNRTGLTSIQSSHTNRDGGNNLDSSQTMAARSGKKTQNSATPSNVAFRGLGVVHVL